MEIRPEYTSAHYNNSSQHFNRKREHNVLPCQYILLTYNYQQTKKENEKNHLLKLNELLFMRSSFSNTSHTQISVKNVEEL